MRPKTLMTAKIVNTNTKATLAATLKASTRSSSLIGCLDDLPAKSADGDCGSPSAVAFSPASLRRSIQPVNILADIYYNAVSCGLSGLSGFSGLNCGYCG